MNKDDTDALVFVAAIMAVVAVVLAWVLLLTGAPSPIEPRVSGPGPVGQQILAPCPCRVPDGGAEAAP